VLTAELLFHKPENPRAFIVRYLEQAKVAGTRPLLTEDDLPAMFGMLDITRRGVVTQEQVNNVQRTILGPSHDLGAQGLLCPKPMLSLEEFMEHIRLKTLKACIPYGPAACPAHS
jgi:hypothetical protein